MAFSLADKAASISFTVRTASLGNWFTRRDGVSVESFLRREIRSIIHGFIHDGLLLKRFRCEDNNVDSMHVQPNHYVAKLGEVARRTS